MDAAAYIAEAIGTFALVFAGAGSVCADASGAEVGLLGIAFAHGLIILAMIATLGVISGGHFNPAVTLALFSTRRIPMARALGYVAAQLTGAALAAFLLSFLFPALAQSPHLGVCRISGVTPLGGFLLETIASFLFMLIIFAGSVDPRTPRALAPLIIGLGLTALICSIGFFTGAALNPARAFGPALAAGLWQNHWIYWAGPCGGALGAALFYDGFLLRKP